MSSLPSPFGVDAPRKRLDVLFDELADLCGQRNAVDGRIVDIVAEIDRDGIWGNTGCRSVAALVAWKTGVSPSNAATITTIAQRVDEFPLCAAELRAGRLSVDQVGVIAEGAADGSDAHYVELAKVATVSQLRTAVRLEPKPDPPAPPQPKRSITSYPSGPGGEYTTWKITLPKLDAATFGTALDAHREALIADWRRDRDAAGAHDPYADADPDVTPRMRDLPVPMPTTVDAFMSIVEAGWDVDAARRPHAQHSTVVAHLDVDTHVAALHLGPLLTDSERRLLLCDATCEVWFERHGQPIGAGRATRTISRRVRRALEHRDRGTCTVPGCGATRGLHAHHLVHWEDGGPTELDNLVLVCPYHHRMHHRGEITITGPADRVVVTDRFGTALSNRSLARPPTQPPPAVAPYQGPTGERAQWWWYTPFEPHSPPTTN
jgi:uncharacterized protein DUF222/HNH endonuclease